MLNQIPQFITTTELQRNPRILDHLAQIGEARIIVKGRKQIGVYTPIEEYQALLNKFKELNSEIRKSRNMNSQHSNDSKKRITTNIQKVKKLAGGLRLKRDYSPEELNKIFLKSYEMLP